MYKKILTLSVVILTAAGFSTSALADLSESHIAVALKSVKFIQPKPKNGEIAAFVYKEGDATSKTLADSLAASMDTSVLQSKVMSSQSIDLSGARLVFITDAALTDIASIATAAQSNKVAAVAAQKSCSEAGNCVLTVETSPKVQIFLSEDAASKAGISFSSAFKMLVKKH